MNNLSVTIGSVTTILTNEIESTKPVLKSVYKSKYKGTIYYRYV